VTWLPAVSCTIVALLDDGTPVVRVGTAAPRPLPMHGVWIPRPPPAIYTEILTERIPADQIELHCELPAEADHPARYTYLAWRDKTGPVWRDLAEFLIGQGAALVAPGTFQERERYLAAEAKARTERRGHWTS
jgi:hypothetical protein